MGGGGSAGAGPSARRGRLRLFIDANLSPVVAVRLREAGHDCIHVGDVGLLSAPDDEILARAAADDRVIISADADFGTLLALGNYPKPSFVLLRSADHLTPMDQGQLLAANLPAVEAELAAGAIVTLARGRLRVRSLPVHPED
jgi:predicted nuclease of predicted toxin-antitoxin system